MPTAVTNIPEKGNPFRRNIPLTKTLHLKGTWSVTILICRCFSSFLKNIKEMLGITNDAMDMGVKIQDQVNANKAPAN